MKNYKYWGNENYDVSPISEEFKRIENPRVLYDYLSEIWCADTCAPRMRQDWTKENMTLGQCSITAFLVQDIFGGKVYGIKRSGGNFHCYNVIGDCAFDLTSEQFGDEKLDYTDNPEQFREVHFSKEEKKERYELLRQRLLEKINSMKAKLHTGELYLPGDDEIMKEQMVYQDLLCEYNLTKPSEQEDWR